MYWEYQTMLFEFRKDGLLGDKYIDDEDVENILNEQGKLGWELVNVTPVQEGLMAFLKKEIRPIVKELKTGMVIRSVPEEPDDKERVGKREHLQVQDGEPVSRPGKKRQQNEAGGESDLIGGIRIS